MASPRFSDQQKLDVSVMCLRARLLGSVSPSDTQIAARLKLRSTDDVLVLLREMEAEGRIEIRRDELPREIDVLEQRPAPPSTSIAEVAEAEVPAFVKLGKDPVSAVSRSIAKHDAASAQPAPRPHATSQRRECWFTVGIPMPVSEQQMLRQAAREAGETLGVHVARRLHASAPAGKPFLRAAVIRAANASPLGFWPYISHLIDAGLAIDAGMAS